MEALDHAYIAKLVTKAQTGDSNAFAELYAATYQRQFGYALRILRDEHLAQDALQETYIRVLKTIGKLQNPQLFVAWLNRINFNTCYDMRRRNQREASVADEVLESYPASGGGSSPEDEVVAVDTDAYLMQQVQNLPVVESQAILMRYYQDMPINDIAAVLDMSRSTVKRHLKSGIERLRRSVA